MNFQIPGFARIPSNVETPFAQNQVSGGFTSHLVGGCCIHSNRCEVDFVQWANQQPLRIGATVRTPWAQGSLVPVLGVI